MMLIKGLGLLTRFALPALVVLAASLPGTAQEAGLRLFDEFHPDNQPDDKGVRPVAPEPLFGGRVIVHMASMPKNINYAIENSASTRRVLQEVSETLLQQDWETFEFVPRLVKSFDIEDMVVLKDSVDAARYPGALRVTVRDFAAKADDGTKLALVVYGKVSAGEGGYLVTPASVDSDLAGPVTVAKADVSSVERGTVTTWYLREDVLWHPYSHKSGTVVAGHQFDVDDVLFSWKLYQNPKVDCDEKRFQFTKITRGDRLNDHAVRFFYSSQYFQVSQTIGVDLLMLPSHIYNLADPDNLDHNPDASADVQATWINENETNRQFVGLGPYRITEFNDEYIHAERFEGYFAPESGGYVDEIRWRHIDSGDTAYTALLNGELDFFGRLKSEDYFGERTSQVNFTDKFYKGYYYLGSYGYTGWNMYRPQLREKVVRQALVHAFDSKTYLATVYKGLARRVNGPVCYNSPAYPHDLELFKYDPELAMEMLGEAGWYDRNGNGVIDKDGVELEISFLMPSGSKASKTLGLMLQESFAAIGVTLTLGELEWATFLERFKSREFDAANLAWVASLESDPEQLWHSKWGQYDARGSNNSGVMEPELDKMIRAIQREPDAQARYQIWGDLQRFVYDLQPYMFGFNVPTKFAMAKDLRGFKAMALDPGYSIRDWYFTSLERDGTRRTREL